MLINSAIIVNDKINSEIHMSTKEMLHCDIFIKFEYQRINDD